MKQKGFIAIPLLIAIIVSIVGVSAITTGVVLHKQGKLIPLVASVSQVFRGTKNIEPEVKSEEPQLTEEQLQSEEINPEETSQAEQELEQARLEAEKAQAGAEKAQAEAEKAQAEAEKAQAEAEKAQSEAERLKAEQEAERAKREAEEAKRKEEQSPKPIDLVSIINQWRPYVVRISCEFPRFNGVGSGVLFSDYTTSEVLTNKHVILDITPYRETMPSSCIVIIPNHGYLEFPSYSKEIFKYFSGKDVGIIKIKNPDDYIKNLVFAYHNSCNKKPAIGESIVILGYAGIGAPGLNITATEGIISGYDGDYFITSAKVEQGNSGGAAIWLKNNCYLGIPTFARVGSVESLARILDINSVIK